MLQDFMFVFVHSSLSLSGSMYFVVILSPGLQKWVLISQRQRQFHPLLLTVLLTVAELILHGVVPGVYRHHQHEPHRGGEQRGQQEVGDGAEGDHARHLGVQAGRACSSGGFNITILLQ